MLAFLEASPGKPILAATGEPYELDPVNLLFGYLSCLDWLEFTPIACCPSWSRFTLEGWAFELCRVIDAA